jgi:hypothetical protein
MSTTLASWCPAGFSKEWIHVLNSISALLYDTSSNQTPEHQLISFIQPHHKSGELRLLIPENILIGPNASDALEQRLLKVSRI